MTDSRPSLHAPSPIVRASTRAAAGLLSACLVACSPAAAPPPGQADADVDPRSDGAENVRLVGHHDLQGRQSLELKTKSNAANGNWAYIGHTPNDRNNPQASDDGAADDAPILNPITGKMEWNGTSIVEISDPANPKLVWHIPNDVRRVNSRSVSVVYDYGFNSSPAGQDYLIRSWDTGTDFKFQIYDITSRDTDPSKISLVSEITGTPPNSCGPGCGGKFIMRAHKGFWSQESGLFYSTAGEPGFRQVVMQIWDLKDPKNPRFISRVALPSQRNGASGFQGEYAHHPVVDEPNHRVYVAYRGAGQTTSWDISDIANPKLVWLVDTTPPGRGPHTVSPIRYDEVPNFKGDALPRTYAFVTDEAAGAADMKPCASGVRTKAYMFDITSEANPFPISTWQVPVGDFCEKGGRFGPHQHAETRNSDLNRFEDKLAWIAYFNAGVRVLDLSDPYNLQEVGYYIPKTNANSHPIAKDQPTAIQINDVEIDHRGLAYATDRVGSGLFIFEYTGRNAATTN
jgi:hypothetical protein